MFVIICQDIIENAIKIDSIDNKYAVEALKKILLSVKWRKHIIFAPELKEEDIDNLGVLTAEEVKLLKYVHSKRQDSNSLMSKLGSVAKY